VTPQELLEYFDSEGIGPGDRIPSDRELAVSLGMKFSTVNRLLLQLRALDLVTARGQRRYRTARTLEETARRQAIVHLLSPSRKIQELFRSTAAHLPGVDWRCPAFGSVLDIRKYLARLPTSQANGIVVWPLAYSGLLEGFRRSGVPVLAIGADPDTGFHTIMADRRRGVELAVTTVRNAGHRNMALLGLRPREQAPPKLSEYEMIREALGGRVLLCQGRGSLERPEVDSAEIADGLRKWMRGKSPPTVVLLENAELLPAVMGACKRVGISVPPDLSIVGTRSDSYTHRNSILTTIDFSSDHQVLTALSLISTLASLPTPEPEDPPLRLLAAPRLRLGATLANLTSQTAPPSTKPSRRGALVWPLDPIERQALVRKINHLPYADYPESLQHPLSLASVANRSRVGRNSWMPGEPLTRLPNGTASIHGIHFRLPASKRGTRTFLKLGPEQSTGAASARLPVKLRAEALCFLHILGHGREGKEIGEYRIRYAPGTRQVCIPLRSRGHEVDPVPEANLQDWWPSFPQISGTNFRPYLITTNDDPFEYERYAYTLLWQNPRPTQTIREIEIRLHRDTPAQLGVLAITAILPTR